MQSPYRFLQAISLLFFSAVSSAQIPQNDIDNYLKHLHQYGRFSGNVLIAKGDKILYEKALGFSDVQMKSPISRQNLFKVGDITQQLTAAALIKLDQQDKLSLNDPISKYYPELNRSDKITLTMLMNHTAGISRDVSFREENQQCEPNNLIDRIIKTSQTYPPSLLFNYTNAGYHLLGGVIEKVTGTDYKTHITEEFLRPLGMKDSSLKLTLSFQLAKSYEMSGLINANITPSGCGWSAGELITSSRDLLVWSRSLMNGKVFDLDLVDEMLSSQFAFERKEISGTNYFLKQGNIDGFQSLLLYEPIEKITIIALSNFQNTNMHFLSFDLVRLLNNQTAINTIHLPKNQLETWQDDFDLIGNYQDQDGVPLQVIYEQESLFARVNQFDIPLTIENTHTLFAKGIDNKIRINRNENNTTKEIVIFSRDGRYLSRFARIQ